MKVYTRAGDDGTTGLLYGGRVPKNDPRPAAYGDVDEAQAAIGLARAEAERDGELDRVLVGLERDLWVLMAELATDPAKASRLTDGSTRVTMAMVERLEPIIDDLTERFTPPTDFVVPGETRVSAQLDLARTVVRRAERSAVGVCAPGSPVVAYLNRLSDLVWTLARWQEGDATRAKDVTPLEDS